MVGHRPLKPFILVRIQVPEPSKNLLLADFLLLLCKPLCDRLRSFLRGFCFGFFVGAEFDRVRAFDFRKTGFPFG